MHQDIYSKLKDTIGAELEFNDQGKAFILLEENVPVCITDSNDSVFLTGLLSDDDIFVDGSQTPEYILKLSYILNREHGCSISLIPDSDQCVLTNKITKSYLSPDEFVEHLYDFLRCLEITINTLKSKQN
ncbi:CesT family type III secretion system chaperone [Escherichia marmotae]|uniref:CesT family type III secretion system chaperone n=1 Tax=Escherichia marmotae TaxID=1499973 RepID=UPI00056F8AA5|nr:CesT family type III secretion system chaperone [Escherichia marmotae]AUT30073.1 molecular chaperone [Escherichia marmotae]